MKEKKKDLRWVVERRLEFIEFRLFWEGHVNRSDLIDAFGISVNQASTDLNRYLGLAAENMVYDKS
ncbi:MAG: WYL domain-containing protein, partial [Rhodospirillaceae bacterium]|nr:WYL domain-containing protein [Rhodospirillaceae bacterium]